MQPSWSPAGTRIAFVNRVTTPRQMDIWVVTPGGDDPVAVTGDAAADWSPVWSPDGTYLYFASDRGGSMNLWRVPMEQESGRPTGEPEPITTPAPSLGHPSVSADGTRIAYSSLLMTQNIQKITLDPTTASVTDFDEELPVLSPDGRWIAYQSNESGRSEVYVRPFPNVDDGKWQVSTTSAFDPVWSPEGRSLFFQTGQTLMVTEVETDPTFSPGTPMEVFSMQAYPFRGAARAYDLAPDGDRFLMRKTGETQTSSDSFNGLIFVENWFQELTERVPIP